MASNNAIPFGIDFGTANTCGSVWWNEKTEVVVANELSSRTTPSYYYYNGAERFVGKHAKNKIGTNPKNVYYDTKRLLTRKIEDPLIQKFKEEWAFELKENQGVESLCEYIVNETYEPLSPVSVSAEIMKYMEECVKKRFGPNKYKVVITVPVYFSFEQIKAIYEAAKLANFHVLSFLADTTAAAIAYGTNKRSKEAENIFIIDVGAGGFSIAIINIEGQIYKTLAAAGSAEVGGRDFDLLIFDWMKKKMEKEGRDIKSLNQMKKFKILLQAQSVKETLSVSSETPVIFSDIFENAKSYVLEKSYFEKMSAKKLEIIENKCRHLLDEIKFSPENIDHIIFVGGSSRMPMVATMLQKIFMDENKFSKVVDPIEVVACGAGIYAAACMKASKKPEIIGLNVRDVAQFNESIQIIGIPCFSQTHRKFEYDFPSQFSIPLQKEYYDSKLFAVGIDLGTTECCAAVIRKSGADFVQIDLKTSFQTMPSYIAFDERKPKCGQIVIDRMRYKSAYSVYDLKRIIGMPFEEIVMDSIWPFNVKEKNSKVKIEIKAFEGTQVKSVEKMYAVLLKHIKDAIEIYQGKSLDETSITIPSNITENQIKATAKAARLAGWQTVHFIPEPIAAAFAYSVEMEIPNNSNIFICDCGGGTLDICIAKVVDNNLNILSCDGDPYLGGRDFDKLLYNHFDAVLKHTYSINAAEINKKFFLIQKCQDIKHTLSSEMEDWIDLNDFDMTRDNTIIIKRNEFEEMARIFCYVLKA